MTFFLLIAPPGFNLARFYAASRTSSVADNDCHIVDGDTVVTTFRRIAGDIAATLNGAYRRGPNLQDSPVGARK
jgi:hypothetical protein